MSTCCGSTHSAIACHRCFKWMCPDEAVQRVLTGGKMPVPVHENCVDEKHR